MNMQEKKDFADRMIGNMIYRLKSYERQMANAKKDIDKCMEEKNYYWLDVACKNLREAYSEYKALKQQIEESESIVEFFTKEEKENE